MGILNVGWEIIKKKDIIEILYIHFIYHSLTWYKILIKIEIFLNDQYNCLYLRLSNINLRKY